MMGLLEKVSGGGDYAGIRETYCKICLVLIR